MGDREDDLGQRTMSLEQRTQKSSSKSWVEIAAIPFAITLTGTIGSYFISDAQIKSAEKSAQRSENEAKQRHENDWGVKVAELYFSKPDLFDITKNPERAQANLTFLVAVAPNSVRDVLKAEASVLPAPGTVADSSRFASLAAVAAIREALNVALPGKGDKKRADAQTNNPNDFTVYLQYPEGQEDLALQVQEQLKSLGYLVHGIQKVRKVPSRLQVRYYLPSQKSLASDLVLQLGKAAGLPATTDNAIQVTSDKKLPPGILEVWIPQHGA